MLFAAKRHCGQEVPASLMYTTHDVSAIGPTPSSDGVTRSTQQCPFPEANRFSASQEIPHILQNPTVHYRIHNSLPPAPYPQSHQSSQCLYIPPTEDTFLYYPPVYAWVFQVVSFHRISPPKSRMHLSCLPTCHMPRPSHSYWFDHPNNIWWGITDHKAPHYVVFSTPPLSCHP